MPSAPGAFNSEPTAGNIDAMWRWKLSEYEELGLREFMGDVRPMFDMVHPVRIPREYRVTTKEVRTPFLRDAGLRIASALVKDTAVPKIEPVDHSGQADQAADIAARWLQAEWAALIAENNGQDFKYISARNLTRDSESVLKVVDRVNAWANFPARTKDEDPREYLKRRDSAKQAKGVIQPFAAKVVDRAQMVFGDSEYGDEWCIEYGMYPTPIIMRDYGMETVDADPKYTLPQFKLGGRPIMMGYAPKITSIGPSATLKMEYVDKDWWCVLINGKMAPGFPKPNPYAPFMPYFRAIAEPALYSLRYYQPALDALLTGKMNWAFLSMFPVPKFKPVLSGQQPGAIDLPIGDNATAPVGMRWKPGFAMMPPAGYDLEFLQPPQTGRDVDVMVQTLRDMIDIAGIPSIFRGIGGARQAGYAINQLMAAANLMFRQMGNSLSRQFERASEFMLHVVSDVIPEELGPVYIKGSDGEGGRTWIGLQKTGRVTETVAPVDELGPVEFRFKPIIPSDEQAMEMIGLQAWTAHAISHETLLTDYMQMDDPQGEMNRIAVEQEINTDPLLHQQMVEQALRQAGIAPPPPPPAPGGLVGPNGQPIASGPPAGLPMPDGQLAGGLPPGMGGPGPLAQLVKPRTPGPTDIHGGGRAPGAYPGEPGGTRRAA